MQHGLLNQSSRREKRGRLGIFMPQAYAGRTPKKTALVVKSPESVAHGEPRTRRHPLARSRCVDSLSHAQYARTERKTLRRLLSLMHKTSLIQNIHGHPVSVHVLKLPPWPAEDKESRPHPESCGEGELHGCATWKTD